MRHSHLPFWHNVQHADRIKGMGGRFDFNPDRVVADTNLWSWTIPTHILYSPKGQTLYRSIGYLSSDQIKSILLQYAQEWEIWSMVGQKVPWMCFNE